MKKLFFILLALPMVAFGQAVEAETREELQLIETIYYDRGVYITTEEERNKLKELVIEMRSDSTLRVHIVGCADKWGGEAVNDRFSYVRAMYIADWIRSCRVPADQIVYVGVGIDKDAVSDKEARRVEISRIVEVLVQPEPQPEPEPEPQPEPETPVVSDPVASQDARSAAPTGEVDPQMQVTPEEPAPAPEVAPAPAPAAPESKPKTLGSISLHTNLLYWLTGMANIGAEYRLGGSPLGIVLNGGYSPVGGADWGNAIGGWYIAPELRYYIPNNEAWFVGAQFLAQGFNYKLSETGYQGSMIGGGVIGGYRLMLTDRFDLDFTLGVGYAKIDYDTYYHSNSVNVLKESDLSKGSIIPVQAGVNLRVVLFSPDF